MKPKKHRSVKSGLSQEIVDVTRLLERMADSLDLIAGLLDEVIHLLRRIGQ